MTTSSPKLGLVLPSQTDPFVTEDLKTNYQKIDASPGTYICTSSTRPAWILAQAGRKILETDTGLEWRWTGTDFVRMGGSGLLKRSDGTWAIAERATSFSTSATTYVKVVALTSVVIPAGKRPLRIEVNWYNAYTDDNNTAFLGAIYRSNTNNAGPLMDHWRIPGNISGPGSGGRTYFSLERNGLDPGAYDFSLQIHKDSGNTGSVYLDADSITPTRIIATEL